MSGSTPRGSRVTQAQRLALGLVDGLDPEHREDLAHDPATMIAEHHGIAVSFHAPSPEPDCSVDGLYHPDPPRISVARSIATREAFSLLHELGHHLLWDSYAVIDAFQQLNRQQERALEEDICDAFAAELLLPEHLVDDVLDGGEITARALRGLADHRRASRAACCVRLAQRLGGDGYLVLADRDGALRFCAAAGDAYRVARTAEQPRESVLARAGRAGRADGTDCLTHRSGAKTPTMYVDAVADDDYVYAVYQSRRPRGMFVTIPDHERKGRRPEVLCVHCGTEFVAFDERCERCDAPPCSDCGRCGCQAASATRLCETCWLHKPATEFPTDEACCEECHS